MRSIQQQEDAECIQHSSIAIEGTLTTSAEEMQSSVEMMEDRPSLDH
jgi:hypothetical protein